MSKPKNVCSLPRHEVNRRLKALKDAGSFAEAARTLGITRPSLTNCLRSAESRGEIPRGQIDQLIKHKNFASVENGGGNVNTLNARVRELETMNRELAQQLSDSRKIHLPAVRPAKLGRATSGDIVRFIIPDSHGSYADQRAISALIGDLAKTSPDEIVMLGDHVDCGGFLAQHHTMGYVAETDYTYEGDIAATNVFLDAIQKAAPKARIHYLEGNHEQRIEKWAVTQCLRNKKDADFLRKSFAPQYVLKLAERGVSYYRMAETYDGMPLPGVLKLGKSHFVHGIGASKHAADQHVRRFNASVFYGHTHRAQATVIRTISTGEIGAWSPGCLCRLQPLWMNQNIADWSHGYTLQFVSKHSGDFLAINIPIIDGKSHLGPLMDRGK
jgi:predicted phosphodiesterase